MIYKHWSSWINDKNTPFQNFLSRALWMQQWIKYQAVEWHVLEMAMTPRAMSLHLSCSNPLPSLPSYLYWSVWINCCCFISPCVYRIPCTIWLSFWVLAMHRLQIVASSMHLCFLLFVACLAFSHPWSINDPFLSFIQDFIIHILTHQLAK